MNELMLLTDGSVDTHSKIGFGAYLVISDLELSADSLRPGIRVRKFENTNSTRLELQTLLWALREIDSFEGKVTVFTDSQNIMGLPARRKRFEENEYRSKKGRHLNNYKLYQEFFKISDFKNLEFIKVRGHQPAINKDCIDRLFTLVDRAARNALRESK